MPRNGPGDADADQGGGELLRLRVRAVRPGHPAATEHEEPHARPAHVHAALQVSAVPESAQQ